MELDAAVVHRERDSIDLLIEVAQARLVIAIELKINAVEHSGQLGRYRRIVERDWPEHRRLLLFLTRRGDAPSADGEGWHALSLRPVADALHAVATRQVGTPDARMMLAAYVAMLRREHLTDERLENLAASLWREHREALEFLMERRPDVKYAFMAILLERRDEAAARLSSLTRLGIVADHSTKSIVRFAVTEWDALPNFQSAQGWTASRRAVLLEWKESGGGVRVQLQLGPTPWRQIIFEALLAAGADTGYKGPIGKSWRQLANMGFSPDTQDESDAAFATLIEATAGFLAVHVATYTPVLPEALALATTN